MVNVVLLREQKHDRAKVRASAFAAAHKGVLSMSEQLAAIVGAGKGGKKAAKVAAAAAATAAAAGAGAGGAAAAGGAAPRVTRNIRK
jgi:hypothetical protein